MAPSEVATDDLPYCILVLEQWLARRQRRSEVDLQKSDSQRLTGRLESGSEGIGSFEFHGRFIL